MRTQMGCRPRAELPASGRGAAPTRAPPGAPPPTTPPAALARRAALAAVAAAALGARAAVAAALEEAAAPAVGDCLDCVGAVSDAAGSSLQTCTLGSTACISTENDDEEHFQPPWAYDGEPAAAAARLVAVATGGAYDPGLIAAPGGVARGDAAAYIVGGVAAVLSNGPMPARPQRRRRAAADFLPFTGEVQEARDTPDGGRYVRLTLAPGGPGASPDDGVLDAEFLFAPNDNIVGVRAASRGEPAGRGELALSFTRGFILDKNSARRRLEALRAALGWETAVVVTDYDAGFNSEAPVWVERVFRPFDERAKFEPSGLRYPMEGGVRPK